MRLFMQTMNLKILTSFAALLALGSNAHAAAGDSTKTDTDSIGKGIVVAGEKKSRDRDGRVKDTSARGPGLEISGGSAFNAYVFKNKRRQASSINFPGNIDNNYSKGRGVHFAADDSRINFEVSGKAGPELGGLEYSFLIGMTGNTKPGTTSIEENRLKLKCRYGTAIMGIHRGVTDFMATGAYKFIGGTGGILGNYKGVVFETSGVLIRDTLAGVAQDQTKLTLITPRYLGFQLGYSYTPDGKHQGEEKLQSFAPAEAKDNAVTLKGQNIHEAALNYKLAFENGLSLEAALTAVFSNVKPTRWVAPTYSNTRSYAAGLVAKYRGFSVGGEFLNNLNSLKPETNTARERIYNNNSGKVYTYGVGYEWGRHAVSLAHLHSKKRLGHTLTSDYGNLKADVASATYNIKLAKGLKAYVEGVRFDYKASHAAGHERWVSETKQGRYAGGNSGHAIAIGTAISF